MNNVLYYTLNYHRNDDEVFCLKKSNQWEREHNNEDMLFARYELAEEWLANNPVVFIEGKAISTTEEMKGRELKLEDIQYFSIGVFRKETPPLFTQQAILEALRNAEPKLRNVLCVTFEGKPELIPWTLFRHGAHAVVGESFPPESCYVGSEVGYQNIAYLYNLYLEAWREHLCTGKEVGIYL